MRLKIELKSDLCTSSGENFNSYIDTDVVFDDYGLPYIPAKRLKGVIKEAALELVEFGLYSQADYEILFGREGNARAAFSIDNAYLERAKEYINDLTHCSDGIISHPQRVLELFTYTRTQTALEQSGAAKENSLRTFRVVNKGGIFQARVKFLKQVSDSQQELLKQAVRMVKHIGCSRTRGLGLVEAELFEEIDRPESVRNKYTLGDNNCINYRIRLNSPILCKTGNGSQEKTDEYIQGSKILGIIAEILGQTEFANFMGYDTEDEDTPIASNAYICEKTMRCTPAPLSYQKRKNQGFADEEMWVKDRFSAYKDEEQWSPLGNVWISPDHIMKSVETQINYHHKRPDNKAIGRATGEDNSSFYQLKSICAGQEFAGYILVNKKQAELLTANLNAVNEVRIGNNKYVEYGDVQLEITEISDVSKKILNTQEFVVKLNSPAILYNEYGMPSSEVSCLLTYLEKTLGLTTGSLKEKKCFVSYEEIGGYNVTWNKRKPNFTALGRGTVLLLESTVAGKICVNEKMFVGERVSEGYGEIEFIQQVFEDVVIKKEKSVENTSGTDYKTDIVQRLLEQQESITLRTLARNAADQYFKNIHVNEDYTAIIGKLLLLSKTALRMDEIDEQIEGIETLSKKTAAQKLIKQLKKCTDKYEMQKVYEIALPEYLARLKYLNRAKKGENK